MLYLLITICLSSLAAHGCTFNANYLKQMEKLDVAAYSKIQIGEVQNFTAVKVRVYDRQLKTEVSNADDPRIQAQFSNQGAAIYYSDNITGKVMRFSAKPLPLNSPGDWDKFVILDASDNSVAVNYVNVKSEKDFVAKIVDNGSTVTYADPAVPEKVFRKQPLPSGTDPSWDGYFVSEDTKYGIFRSLTNGIYRLGFVELGTNRLLSWDFQPLGFGFQSTKHGMYRGGGYDLRLQQWFIYDFIPTQKLICFDLARAYDAAANDARRATTHAALQTIIAALAGYSRASISGIGQSTYNGYYAGNSLVASGVTTYSGYAQTYDYRYLAAGASNLLDTIFRNAGTLSDIKAAMQQQQCGF